MSDKVAIVTGGSRGLGKAVVSSLAFNGYNVWACANRQNDEFEKFAAELGKKADVWVEPLYLDLANSEEIITTYRNINKKNSRIDVLINNAGIGHMKFLQMTGFSEIEKIYRVNVLAPILLSQLVMRNMSRRKSGKIINVASTAATEVYEGNSIYGSSKAALEAFTRSFAPEAYRYGVTVNAIAPGLIDTEMSEIFEGNDPEEPIRHTALGRKIMPSEIAGIILSLLSDEMKIINGEVICINGGHK